MQTKKISIKKLSKNLEPQIKKFNCEDEDLNSFIREDSFFYEKTLLAKTYLVFIEENLIGYFSVL